MSVHRTISTAVLQRSATARVRTALAEPAGSGDVSSASAASPDAAATKSRGCVATCDFIGRETFSQSYPYRLRNDDGGYERCTSGHVAGVMKPRADAGQDILSPGGAGTRENTNGIMVMGYPRMSLVA